MGQLALIGEGHAKKVQEVLEALLDRSRRGKLISLAFIGEELDDDEPVSGMVGRYREDPAKLAGELVIMKAKVAQYAARRRGRDFLHSVK